MADKKLGNALALLQTFIKEAQKSEQMAKKATDPSEPTSHPVMKSEDGTQKAQEGAKGTELTSDIRKAYGESGVTGQQDAGSAPNNSEKSIGEMKPLASDSMGGNVQQPKATKDAPPGKGPGDNTFSEKYSELASIGNRLLGSLSTLVQQKQAAMPPQLAAALGKKEAPKEAPHAETKAEEKKEGPAHEKTEGPKVEQAEHKTADAKMAAAEQYPDDAAAGYMVAQSLLEELNQNQMQQKQAADQFENIIKTAQADAELYASFVSGLTKGAEFGHFARTKAAEGLPMSEEGSEGGEGAADAGGMPEGAGGGGLPPEIMAQLAGGGGGAGPEAGSAGGEGGGDNEAVIDELAQALDQAGVTPEELAQAIAQSQGGGEGGEGGAGGPPPEMAGKAASARVKMANALKSLVA
jgi:hypothetical protein